MLITLFSKTHLSKRNSRLARWSRVAKIPQPILDRSTIMTTPRVLQKFVRRLYRSLFHSVPSAGLKEIDLSRLSPVQFNLEMPTALRIPEAWDAKN
jgi:hypothetical protein